MVEDEETVRNVLGATLRRFGYAVVECGDAAAALVQGAQYAERQVVVGREDRGDVGHPGEYLAVAVAGGG